MGLLTGAVEAIPARTLTRDTCDRYNYQVGQDDTGKIHIANYYDETGTTVVAQKVRGAGKSFRWIGDPKPAGLFGQQLCRDGGKMIVITEGEIDALSLSQARGNTWPVVSIPNGAQGARRDLAKHVGWLEKYEKIILCFDNDDAGNKAVSDCLGLFTPGKLYVMRLPLKDANDMLKAGRGDELVRAMWDAKQVRPDGIRSVAELKDEALAPPSFGLPYPFRSLTKATLGITRPAVIGWGAGVGSGKSTFMRMLMATAMRPDMLDFDPTELGIERPAPRPVGTILFEERPARTLRTLAGMIIGKRVELPGVSFDQDELVAAMDSLDGLFFPMDLYGARDWDAVRSAIRFLILSEGVKDVILDPMTALVADAEDERRELDKIMADLSGLAETNGATLHYVSHLTTPAGTPHEEGGRVMEKHFTGSRALARWSHAMLGLERNKQELDSPTVIRGLKDRLTGEAVGPLCAIEFDRETGRMHEVPLPEDGGSTHQFKDETYADL